MPELRAIALSAAFTLQLQTPILEGLATVGKFDGRHIALACGTTGGKVVVHAGHEASAAQQVRYLNVNRNATGLLAAKLRPDSKGDALLLAAQTTLVAYDVDNNADIFFHDVPDGIGAMVFGSIGTAIPDELVILGGNCNVVGFDGEGRERWWNVTGDNVTSLALLPWSRASTSNVLLVGGKDFSIRVFEGDTMRHQITEADAVSHLLPLGPVHPGRFAYALSNGTVGVYEQSTRTWRHKSKHKITALQRVDVDLDGQDELLCGWSNGRFEVRGDIARSGEITGKENYATSVSAILRGDYRNEGRDIPLVCTYDGDVRGIVALVTRTEEAVQDRDSKLLEEALQKMQNLQFEVSNLEKQIAARRSEAQTNLSGVPDVNVTSKLRPNVPGRAIEIVLQVTHSAAQLHSAVFTADAIFGNVDSIVVTADTPNDTLIASLQLEKDLATDINVSVVVGFRGYDVLQVHSLVVKLPRYAMFVPVASFEGGDPAGYVSVRVPERLTRVSNWIQESFHPGPSTRAEPNQIDARFLSLRDPKIRVIFSAAAGSNGELALRCDDIDVAGDLLTDMATRLNITELSSIADFPAQFEEFKTVMAKVEEFNNVRMKLSAEMADSTQFVKSLVIKAEDARILGDMRAMKKTYGSLYEVNRELIGEFLKRSNNHNELLAALKEVNAMIQKAGKLRVGTAKANLVAECRNAIKGNNILAFYNIMRTGKP